MIGKLIAFYSCTSNPFITVHYEEGYCAVHDCVILNAHAPNFENVASEWELSRAEQKKRSGLFQ